LLGLESIAKTTLETSAVYQSLKRRLAGSSARSGLELLNQIAEDLQSSLFTRLVQRIQAAQQSGGVSDIDQAVAGAIEELNEEIGYQSEEQMQRLPLRITLLAMPFLLGPIVTPLFLPAGRPHPENPLRGSSRRRFLTHSRGTTGLFYPIFL